MEWGGSGELEEGAVGVDQGGEQADTGVDVLSYLNKLQGNSMLFDELYYKNVGDDYISSLKPSLIRLVFEATRKPKTVLEVYKNSAKLSDGRVWQMSRYAKLLGDAVGANSAVPMKNYLWLDPVSEDTFSGAANILEADSASEDVIDN
ncbi:hypothetical protein NDU88_003797 [Pleurodeles waltl]|uniref:Uncharacterized protein n=1 Tax=Pleurodeles waltl TaxID=8319 RepID=A0AAV7WTQ7_PLEWA|nr:hypothetical protein NDU88_003797 [Pleurodeles waltl]